MNVLLVYPKYPDTFWSFKHALNFISKKAVNPPLGLITVSALLPSDWQRRLVDMNINKLTEKDLEWADCVFLSAMSVQEESTRQVIALCRNLGLRIVAGGPLFSASPEKFDDVDHLVLDEAESSLLPFLDDYSKGHPRHVYRATEYPSLVETPLPHWHLVKKNKYLSMNIQYSRGCPFDCEFCNISSLYGSKVRTKSANQVVAELESLYLAGWRGPVFFVDDNFIGNRRRVKNEVLPAMKKWMKGRRHPFVFSTEASINLSDDEELMKLMIQSGFESIFIGIETTNDEGLAECSKFQNKGRDLLASVENIQKFGLRVRGGFIVGFDSDSFSTFDTQIEFIQKSGIITAMVGLLNAPRGTRLYKRIVKEGRLLDDITGDNTDMSTNFVPAMGFDELSEGYRKIIRGIYSPAPYYKRVKDFLGKYKPKVQRTMRVHLGHILLHFGYSGALVQSVFLLGIKDKDRRHFWGLFFWSLFRHPHLFRLAITYAIYGFHFRKVFENSL